MIDDLTAEEIYILRFMLGLSFYNREKPTRNSSHGLELSKHAWAIALLVQRGLAEPDFMIGPGGHESYYKTTNAGREVVLLQPWK